MDNVCVLFGKPEAGKGTRQSEFLEGREKQFAVLSASSLLKKEKKAGTELGKLINYYMETGLLVPDEIICKLVIPQIKAATEPLISDGFPRTKIQAKAMLDAGIIPTVIEFVVSDDVVLERAKHRIVCNKCGESYTTTSFKRPKVDGICDKCGGKIIRRADDNPEVVQNRLKEYEEKTHPVLEYFANQGIPVCTIDNCNPEASKLFEKHMTKLITSK